MNIPNKVRVGSMEYTIKKGKKTLILNGKECSGLITYDEHLIELNVDSRDLQCVEQTFLHELVHAIAKERNINLNSGNNSELVVDEIATGLHQVIKDNPEIFKEELK